MSLSSQLKVHSNPISRGVGQMSCERKGEGVERGKREKKHGAHTWEEEKTQRMHAQIAN